MTARQLIKGGGGALTREKIIAACSRVFVCIVDAAKFVPTLGTFPLPVEVIPMARTFVAGRLAALGGRPVLRAGYITDNGNQILDVHDLRHRGPGRARVGVQSDPGRRDGGVVRTADRGRAFDRER